MEQMWKDQSQFVEPLIVKNLGEMATMMSNKAEGSIANLLGNWTSAFPANKLTKETLRNQAPISSKHGSAALVPVFNVLIPEAQRLDTSSQPKVESEKLPWFFGYAPGMHHGSFEAMHLGTVRMFAAGKVDVLMVSGRELKDYIPKAVGIDPQSSLDEQVKQVFSTAVPLLPAALATAGVQVWRASIEGNVDSPQVLVTPPGFFTISTARADFVSGIRCAYVLGSTQGEDLAGVLESEAKQALLALLKPTV